MPAGGAALRMAGADKLALTLAGSSVLDHTLRAACAVCSPVVAVGPGRPTSVAGVEFVTERQPGGGPVPAVLAGIGAMHGAGVVIVVGGDFPLVTPTALAALAGALAAQPECQVAAARDERGVANPLMAAYRLQVLVRAGARLRGGRHAPAAELLAGGRVATVDVGPGATLNVNRPEDLAAARAMLAGRSPAPV